jgi:hypothetical protein
MCRSADALAPGSAYSGVEAGRVPSPHKECDRAPPAGGGAGSLHSSRRCCTFIVGARRSGAVSPISASFPSVGPRGRPHGGVARRRVRARGGAHPVIRAADPDRSRRRPFRWPGGSSRIPVRLEGSGSAIPRPLILRRIGRAPLSSGAAFALARPLVRLNGAFTRPLPRERCAGSAGVRA